MFFKLALVHHGKLCGTGNKHGKNILLLLALVFPVVLNHALYGQGV